MPDVLGVPTTCQTCGGHEFWDNRADKKNPRGPDFKCKNTGCAEGYWLKVSAPGKKPAPAVSPPAPTPSPLALVDGDAGLVGNVFPASTTSWNDLKAQHMECVIAALAEASVMDATNKVGSDPVAVAALANTLFIERRKRGV